MRSMVVGVLAVGRRDPRVKLGVGPAISNSVSSVFKEMRRHLRVSESPPTA